MSPLILLLLACPTLSASAPSPQGGTVLNVGPGQPFATIQAAVDASVSGDMVLVDPGSYGEFAVNGKGISIVATSSTFTVLESSSPAPAILVENVAAPDQVTIIGAHIDHGVSFDTPAVLVRSNTGAIRLSHLDVRQVQDLIGTSARAVVQVEDTKTFWLIDSAVWTTTARRASRAGAAEFDEVVSGVELRESNGVVQNVKLRGYEAINTHGGDALRVVGLSSVWIVDDPMVS